jgi:threonine dehydrogenase-like Zn-dependent dehydrogenase
MYPTVDTSDVIHRLRRTPTGTMKAAVFVEPGRTDLPAPDTHLFPPDRREEAYDLFADPRDGVLKVAIFVS